MKVFKVLSGLAVALLTAGVLASPGSPTERLRVHLSWGHCSPTVQAFHISFVTNEVEVSGLTPILFESGDTLQGGRCETHAGGGDVDGVEFTLSFAPRAVLESTNVQRIWAYLFANSDADTVRRLRLDAALRRDNRKLTIQLAADGSRGFSVTVDQLLMNKVFWVPELDVFLSTGEPPISYDEHQKQLKAWSGQRVIESLQREPEATYEQYKSRWEDMGSPQYSNPASVAPGHIVCVTWDSAIPKFGIDRGAGVWSDYGNPDHFHFGFGFGEQPGLVGSWRSQKLADGLPIVTTVIERNGVRYEVEQFAFPLYGPPAERQGDLKMVLLQKVRLTELLGKAQEVQLSLSHSRELKTNSTVLVRRNGPVLLWQETETGGTLLGIDAPEFKLQTNFISGNGWKTNRIVLRTLLPAKGKRELIAKLPSPIVAGIDREAFLKVDYELSRTKALKFWSDYLSRGARFEVPEQAVNELFRANLWHALRLPRRHRSGNGNTARIDLPYSNFAYDQHGTPWPVNQAVYVDYMLYDLRGYPALSAEELATIYSNNQEPNGHIGGFANWGVYTPGMIYAVAQQYLLSGDRAALSQLLRQTLKAMDWCLEQVRQADERTGSSGGLVLAPLNDLSHEARAWAFNQAYLYAGMELLGRVLSEIQHPRAEECLAAARALRESIQRGFACATTQSPLVQLRDHTWVPYVPCDALTPRRQFEVWYPTDVDCGALHLCRLNALDPMEPLTTYLLNDHEDNLFLKQWGMANEPVYNPHATVYLLRDEVEPAIRCFYSMMACAFSHSTFEPVEHRWSWGQYFGPPSTDGAWFELYRHMLVNERDDNTLLLCQATPRTWLADGKQIRIERAPTYYGRLDLTIDSRASAGRIDARIQLEPRQRPSALLLRLRHPAGGAMRSVSVNGKQWMDFDTAKEWIRIPDPHEQRYEVVARY